uniref:Uncharacterized protein n=1 Tax=Setaria italica TaxID=4555 RepID=K4AP23_SETIT
MNHVRARGGRRRAIVCVPVSSTITPPQHARSSGAAQLSAAHPAAISPVQ